MKTTLLQNLLLLLNFSVVSSLMSVSYSQSFSASGVPLTLNGTTSLNPSCPTISNSSITFTVSGVGTLSASNQLLEIRMRLRTPGSIGRLAVSVFLKSPSGTCVQIATKMGDVPTSTGTNKNLDYTFRAPQLCLNKYPDYEATNTPLRNFEDGVDSRAGVFSTVGDISTAFNGENPNGTWTIYFGRTNNLYNTLPSVQSSSLTFGEPIPVAAANPSAGTSCAGAIVWDGSPLCATTAGHVNTQPIAPAATISGCTWMTTSENNLWIAFTPNHPDVCVNISGVNYISGTASGVQSIIVSPTNAGSPCAGTWNVANCPRDDIYSSNVGSIMSSNHCFTATPGQTYYLIVDGNAGAVTELYISGIDGLPVILAAKLISFDYECTENGLELNWITASESNNDYFIIEYSEDTEKWIEIGRKQGMGTSAEVNTYTHVLNSRLFKGYYRLKQVDFDGKENRLKTIAVNNCENDKEIKIIPNPSTGIIHLLDIKDYNITEVSVVNLVGSEVFHTGVHLDQKVLTIDLSSFPKGIYFVNLNSTTGLINTNRIVIE